MTKEFPARVGPRTLNQVRTVLTRSASSLSIPQLAAITGKSYPTIKRAVEDLKAEVTDGHPKRYSLQSLEEDFPQIGDSEDNVLVPLQRYPDWVLRWNNGAARVGAGLAKISIEQDSDPKALVDMLTSAAVSLASLTYAIEQVQHRPDWFELLGGVYDAAEDEG